uniref:Uncharacterized protein n=1 Tax=Meloidogyne enterolobii TaxID=390850 RepID=A0A6V7UEG6_MELEN|nr:unnamed protein product [Meloidogyne enterolobii]
MEEASLKNHQSLVPMGIYYQLELEEASWTMEHLQSLQVEMGICYQLEPEEVLEEALEMYYRHHQYLQVEMDIYY